MEYVEWVKTCARCGVEGPVENFPWKVEAKGWRQPYCHECMKLYRREHYRNNPAPYKERAIAARNLVKDDIQKLKEGKPCSDCGGLFPPYVLDFDHRDPLQKVGSVSVLVRRTWSTEKVLEEVAKCDLVCANCHRIRSHKTRPKGVIPKSPKRFT